VIFHIWHILASLAVFFVIKTGDMTIKGGHSSLNQTTLVDGLSVSGCPAREILTMQKMTGKNRSEKP
jgi:hypothetical protein